MSAIVDPFSLALFQSVGAAGQALGTGLLGRLQQDRQAEKEMALVLDWLNNPTAERFAAASQTGAMEKFLVGLQQLATREKTEAEAAKITQEAIQAQLETQAIGELAQELGVSNALARMIYQKPDLLQQLQKQTAPLAHLEAEERKIYFDDVATLRNDLSAADAAFRLATTGEPTYVDELNAKRPIHENRLKKLRGSKSKAKEHGLRELPIILHSMAEKQVSTRLYESGNISAEQRRRLERQIVGSPQFQELIHKLTDETITTAEDFTPAAVLEAVNMFVDQQTGYQDYLQQVGNQEAFAAGDLLGQGLARASGRMVMPTYEEIVRGVPQPKSSTEKVLTEAAKREAEDERLRRVQDLPREGRTSGQEGAVSKVAAPTKTTSGKGDRQASDQEVVSEAEALRDQTISQARKTAGDRGAEPERVRRADITEQARGDQRAAKTAGPTERAEQPRGLTTTDVATTKAIEFDKNYQRFANRVKQNERTSDFSDSQIQDAYRGHEDRLATFQRRQRRGLEEQLIDKDRTQPVYDQYYQQYLKEYQGDTKKAKEQAIWAANAQAEAEQILAERYFAGGIPLDEGLELARTQLSETPLTRKEHAFRQMQAATRFEDTSTALMDALSGKTQGYARQKIKGTQIERQPIEEEIVSFKGGFNKFAKRAQTNPTVKGMSKEQLREAYDNHGLLSRIRSKLEESGGEFTGDLLSDLEYSRRVNAILQESAGTLPAEENAQRVQQAGKQVALEAAIAEEFFFRGVPMQEGQATAREAMRALPKELKTKLFSSIKGKEDLLQALNAIFSDTPEEIAQSLGFSVDKEAKAMVGDNLIKEMPEDIAENAANILVDTMIVGGLKSAIAAGDGAWHGAIYSAIHKAVGGASLPSMLGYGVLYSAADIYRSRDELGKNRFFQAFFVEPKTQIQRQRNIIERRNFADEYADFFTDAERKQLINGTFQDGGKVLDLIYKDSGLRQFVDFVVAPTQTLARKTHIVAKTEAAHPSANPSAVRAMELFGELSGFAVGVRAGQPKAGARPQVRQGPKTIEVKPDLRSRVVNARSKLLQSIGITGEVTGEQKAYQRLLNQWASSPGDITYVPYRQTPGIFSQTLPRNAIVSGAYFGTDYYLDNHFDDAVFAQNVARLGFGLAGQLLEAHYYNVRRKAFEANSNWQQDQCEAFARDFGGGPGKGSGNGGVSIQAPHAQIEIQYGKGGIVKTSPTTTPPKNVPEGPVSRTEFTKPQSSNVISQMGLAQNMELDLPDFVRAQASETTSIDLDAGKRYIARSWQRKNQLIEDARQRDLAGLVSEHDVERLLGDSYVGEGIPKTNDLQKMATRLYGEAEALLEGVDIKPLVQKIQERVNTSIAYFEANPTLGAQPAKKLAIDVESTIAHPQFQARALFDYHKKINKERRALANALEKEYSPEKAQLLDFYTALDHDIRESLPDKCKTALQVADNAYYAYKQSESIDALTEKGRIKDIDQWAKDLKSFEPLLNEIYTELRDSNAANALRKAFLHDQYIREAMNEKHIQWARHGEIVRRGSSTEEALDLSSASNAIHKAAPLSKAGFWSRIIHRIFNVLNTDRLGERSEKAWNSTPYAVSEDFSRLVDASNKGHDLREIRTPLAIRQETPPEIIGRIQTFRKDLEKRVKAANIEKVEAEIQEHVVSLATQSRALREAIDAATDAREQARLLAALEKVQGKIQDFLPSLSKARAETLSTIYAQNAGYINDIKAKVFTAVQQANRTEPQTGRTLHPRRSLSEVSNEVQRAPQDVLDRVFQEANQTQSSEPPQIRELDKLRQRILQYIQGIQQATSLDEQRVFVEAIAKLDAEYKRIARSWGNYPKDAILDEYKAFKEFVRRLEDELYR